MNVRTLAKRIVGTIFNSGVSKPSQWLVDWIRGGDPSSSGEQVSEASAMGLSAYLACIKNISEDCAKLPLGIYRRLEPRGRQAMREHPLHRILHDESNEEMTAFTFRETITQHALGWHGGFAEIIRARSGQVAALYPLDPTAVSVMRTSDSERRLFYAVQGKEFQARDILHLHGLGMDGVTSYVIARLAKEAIGNALAAQKFSGSFFGNGTVTTGIIKVPDAMSETAFKHLRESFHERHAGPENQHKPIILEEGAEWQTQTASAKESQMIEAMWNSVEEICRLFRMPPHKIQHLLRATFSNIEMQALEYVQDCLLGWLVRWESEINRKLLLPAERRTFYAKHNATMLLRGDSAARSAFYREMFNIGAMSDNDIRELEDLNPIEGGDAYFVNAALVPLEMAANGEHLTQNQPEPAPEEPSAEQDDDPVDDAVVQEEPSNALHTSEREYKLDLVARVAAAHTTVIEKAIGVALKVEHEKHLKAHRKGPVFKSGWSLFTPEHEKYIESQLSPSIMALSDSVNAILDGASVHA